MASETSAVPLGAIITLQRGFDLPTQSRTEGAVPIVSSSGVSGRHAEARAKGPGVVTGRYGTIGQVFYINEDFWPLNTTLFVSDFKGNNPRFISYLLQTIDFLAYSDKSGVPGVNRNHIHQVLVRQPPLAEQESIAYILGTLDDKIELNRRMNATLEAIARTLFHSWFVNFDPVRAKSEGREPEGMDAETAALFPDAFEDSELGPIPAGWVACTVDTVTDKIFSGGTPDTRKPEYWNGSLPWFSSGETRNTFIIDTDKGITEKGVSGSSTRLAVPGDILIASAGQGFTRGQTSYCAIETYINQSVVALRADKNICHPMWLFYNLSRRYEEMRSISDSHSSRGSLTTKLLGMMEVCLPSKPLVDTFSNVAYKLAEQQISNLRETQILSSIRDALLPKLISGQIRVPLNMAYERIPEKI